MSLKKASPAWDLKGEPDPAQPRTHILLAPRNSLLKEAVTLHLYLPNGEFIIEVFESKRGDINSFIEALENGDITPDMDLDLGDSESVPCYALVFNDIVLDEHWDWSDVPGVSFTEPNFITVVTYDRPVHYIRPWGIDLPRRRYAPATRNLCSNW